MINDEVVWCLSNKYAEYDIGFLIAPVYGKDHVMNLAAWDVVLHIEDRTWDVIDNLILNSYYVVQANTTEEPEVDP